MTGFASHSAAIAVFVAFALAPSVDGQCGSCAGTHSRCQLIVWSSAWCEPCRRFWHDYREDDDFRTAIDSRFDLLAVDVDRHPGAARAAGILQIPNYQSIELRFAGYEGKDRLLERLGVAATGQVASPVDARHPRPQSLAAPSSAAEIDGAERSGPIDVLTGAASESTHADSDPSMVPAAEPSRKWSIPDIGTAIGSSIPIGLTMLQLLGVIGGSAATGGIGVLALRTAWRLFIQLRRRQAESSGTEGSTLALRTERGDAVTASAPFPRHLDEARQLLKLRQSEGRVVVLDALRGMFLDDELQKLTDSADERDASIAFRLRNAIDARVDEAAPLSTTID